MRSPTPLADGESIGFLRLFHVEAFRGGMNRLLLRAMPTEENRERVAVLMAVGLTVGAVVLGTQRPQYAIPSELLSVAG
ncbi:MAG: hypothetical protein KUG57_03780 [Ilumatobacteraceae bacterium]|nr:hypothetical protein [Ilumatobacteraceae bacterium]